ncbi:superoxide dismutase family protein [Anoxybacterium hadale]|uniref:Superoxide dismutase family protein n=1 Tax=Anoxybacterium hadale TaxID=3408580 RepID=A0ACD1A760_9FIRM|nr:superoxide dismutase family protein [Clostridiales bacterium]
MLDQTIKLMYETMSKPPVVCAHLEGSSEIHKLVGDVYLYPFLDGTLLVVDVEGIPFSGFYGFHIHQHGPCIMGEGYTGFHDVGGHFSLNPDAPHPYHSGDLPVLMSFYGHAYMIVYTDRFTPDQVLGRAMIIHEWPDDYRTQPTGNAGQHIGCGTFFPCCFDQREYMGGMQGFPLGERVGIPQETMPQQTMPQQTIPQEAVPLVPQPIGPPGAPPVAPSLSGPTGGLPGPFPSPIPGIMPPNSSTGAIPGIMPPNSSTGAIPGIMPPGSSVEGLSVAYHPHHSGAQEHTQARYFNRFYESYQPIY